MGEWRTGRPPDRRLTVVQAADVLGITPEAVRGRIRRGTLRAEREAGRVYVVLDADQPRPTADPPTDRPDALNAELRDRLRYVERQLEAERQAHAEARRIIAGLIERIPPAIEAPASPEPPEAPERGTDEQQGRGPIPEDTSPQTPSERPWWRRLFEG